MGILAPSLIKLGHTLYGHSEEEHCTDYGTNHIHDGNLECDFQDFTLVNKVLFNSSYDYVTLHKPQNGHSYSHYISILNPLKIAYQASRAPPTVS